MTEPVRGPAHLLLAMLEAPSRMHSALKQLEIQRAAEERENARFRPGLYRTPEGVTTYVYHHDREAEGILYERLDGRAQYVKARSFPEWPHIDLSSIEGIEAFLEGEA